MVAGGGEPVSSAGARADEETIAGRAPGAIVASRSPAAPIRARTSASVHGRIAKSCSATRVPSGPRRTWRSRQRSTEPSIHVTLRNSSSPRGVVSEAQPNDP